MSALENLRKARTYVAGANFISAAIMIITFFVLRNIYPDGATYWVLIAGIIFAISGILFIWFVRRLEKRFEANNIH